MYFYYVQNIGSQKKTQFICSTLLLHRRSTPGVLSQRFLFRNGHVERSFVHVAV